MEALFSVSNRKILHCQLEHSAGDFTVTLSENGLLADMLVTALTNPLSSEIIQFSSSVDNTLTASAILLAARP